MEPHARKVTRLNDVSGLSVLLCQFLHARASLSRASASRATGAGETASPMRDARFAWRNEAFREGPRNSLKSLGAKSDHFADSCVFNNLTAFFVSSRSRVSPSPRGDGRGSSCYRYSETNDTTVSVFVKTIPACEGAFAGRARQRRKRRPPQKFKALLDARLRGHDKARQALGPTGLASPYSAATFGRCASEVSSAFGS